MFSGIVDLLYTQTADKSRTTPPVLGAVSKKVLESLPGECRRFRWIMRIGIDALFEDSTGTGGLTYLRNVIREIAIIGTQDQFFVFVRDDTSKLLDPGLPNIRVVPCRRRKGSIGRIFSQHCTLAYMVRKLNLEVLLCPGNVASIFTAILVVLVIQNRLQFTARVSEEYRLQPVGVIRTLYKDMIGRVSLRKAKVVLCVSRDVEEVLINALGVPSSKIKVVYLGVDLKHFTNKLPLKTDRKNIPPPGYILGVGRLLPSKNHHTLIRAFARYCDSTGNGAERLVIVGNDFGGRKDYLLRLAFELGVASRVSILGFVPYDEMADVYNCAALFVHLSHAESFCFPVIEAMACGVPFVASDVGGSKDLGKTHAGWLVEPESVPALNCILKSILENRAELKARGERGGEHVRRHYSWAASAERLERILTSRLGVTQ